MAKLVVSQNGMVEGHYFLDKPRFTLGRLPDSDIYLNHPGVSNIHAVIVTVSNDHILEDLGSTNGVLVNSRRVMRHVLTHRDLIQIGPGRVPAFCQPGIVIPAPQDPRPRRALPYRLAHQTLQIANRGIPLWR